MKTKTLLSVLVFGLFVSAFGQKATMELTFTAKDSGQNIPLDSILIKNLTQGWDTTLYAPDTVLVFDYVSGIENSGAIGEKAFVLSQNHPNPFKGKTEVDLFLLEKENVKITVWDILGSELTNYENTLNRGNHSFAFYSGNQKYYFLTVTGKQTSKTIKMLNINSNTAYAGKCKIVYIGYKDNMINYKSQEEINNFGFSIGDTLKYTCYSYIGERTIIDSPTGNQTYTFQYAGNPCPEMPTITDIDGNIYNTVQIGDQCWMKENLRTTNYNNGTPIPNVTDDAVWQNLTTGAYVWYDNDISWKDPYGALYNWHTTIDTNGLCPTDWHVATNDEWTALTDFIGGTGSPHGNELKSCRQVNSPLGGGCDTTEHPRWDEHNTHYGTDDYGFSGLPGGYRGSDGTFNSIGSLGIWWSSTESSSSAWFRLLSYNSGYVLVSSNNKRRGRSVRCLMDF
ncbi:MAG: hypothetical protein DRJ05_04680 [Bacteroidetes bacterium]|nr:MAG: hypothetical protein DRJ05_04680 [Bacteroidota bacterium]